MASKPDKINDYAKPQNLDHEASLMWDHVMSTYQLNRAECRLLVDLCREISMVNRLEKEWADASTLVRGSQGQPVGNPIIQDLARHRQVLAGLVKQLAFEKRKTAAQGDPAEDRKKAVVTQMDKWRRGGEAAAKLDVSPPDEVAFK